MFLDESGEADISKPDPRFNTFVLCAIVFREDHYVAFNDELIAIKNKFFGTTDIVFHSYEMRKKLGVFDLFFNQEILSDFYLDIGNIFKKCEYKIIACIIDKERYKLKYPHKNYAYEESLKFICERGIRLVGDRRDTLHLCLEKRAEKKDSILKSYYSNFIKYGTEFVSTDQFRMFDPKLHFRGKMENKNGLQFADLCAYPIARKAISPESPQPTFDLIEPKFYCNSKGAYKGIGLKTFP